MTRSASVGLSGAANGPGDYASRGAYFTPSEMVRPLVEWAIRASDDSVLEPAAGDGRILNAVRTRQAAMGLGLAGVLHGVEIDPVSAAQLRSELPGVEVTEADFLALPVSKKYDVVIGNPPFNRWHSLDSEQRAGLERLRSSSDMRFSRRAGVWAYFVTRAMEWLNDGGRLAFVLPEEFLAAQYGEQLQRVLLDSFASVEVRLLVGPRFLGAQVNTVLLLADGYGGKSEVFHDPREPTGASAFPHDGFVSLEGWGTLKIGTVSGADKFFLLTSDEIERNSLSESEYHRLVPIREPRVREFASFGLSEWESVQSESSVSFLFCPELPIRPESYEYISRGEALQIDRGYKTSRRNPWWKLRDVVRGDLLIPYISNEIPRFIANPDALAHTNAFHALEMHPDLRKFDSRVVALSAANSLTMLYLEQAGHRLGGGGLKLELRVLRSAPVPSADSLAQLSISDLSNVAQNSSLDEVRQYVDSVLWPDTAGIRHPHRALIQSAYLRRREVRLGRG